jgi:hypothetical protein
MKTVMMTLDQPSHQSFSERDTGRVGLVDYF